MKSSDGSLEQLYLASRRWKLIPTSPEDPANDPPPLQWTLLDPEVDERQLVEGIEAELGRNVEISPRGSLFRFLRRFEGPIRVEVGQKQSEMWSTVGMASGTVSVRRIFTGGYCECLRVYSLFQS